MTLNAVRSATLLTAPEVSLLTAAQFVPESKDDAGVARWEGGFEVRLEGCGCAHAWDMRCGNATPKCEDPSPGIRRYEPFAIYSTDTCSTWGASRRGEVKDRIDRARRAQTAALSWVIERELWEDSLGLGNPRIQDPSATVLTTSPADIITALALIEDAIGDCYRGAGVMIHMRPYLFTKLSAIHSNLRFINGRWVTPMGTIIVPGRGYNGGAPDGTPATAAAEWMYATPIVQYRLGEELVIPENVDDLSGTVKRDTNDLTVLVERTAAVSFDPSCCLLAAQVSR